MITYRDPVFCFVVLSNDDFCLSRQIIVNLGCLNFILLWGIYCILLSGNSLSSGSQYLILLALLVFQWKNSDASNSKCF